MGERRIRLCKSCGRKFTPKNQKPAQVEDIQTTAIQDEAADVAGPEDSVVAGNEQPEAIEMQIPEQ